MSGPSPDGAGLGVPEAPTSPCAVCGVTVPDERFCGACGAHRLDDSSSRAARRTHAYAPAPDEPVLRLSVVSSLFPHLAHRSRGAFRAGFAAVIVALAVLSALRLQAPVIAVSVFGVPLLFGLYLREIEVFERERAVFIAAAVGLGGAFGTGWALLAGRLVAGAIQPTLHGGPGAGRLWVSAVVVPATGQLLMIVPALVLRIRAGAGRSLEGFVVGAAGALGFVLAATLTDLAPELGRGVVAHRGVASVATEALVRGLTVPVVAAAASGLIGAGLWARRRHPQTAPGRWMAAAGPAVAFALAVQIGLGVADVTRPRDAVVLAAHAGAAAALLLVLRAGLHHVLIHEEHEVGIGPPQVCTHCHHVVPEMPFCPHCGAAERARSGRHPAPAPV